MLYAFLFPLLGGLLPALAFAKKESSLPLTNRMQLWHFGISALTVGSFFSGALEIYGTSSHLTVVYWIAGGICLLLSLLSVLFVSKKSREPSKQAT